MKTGFSERHQLMRIMLTAKPRSETSCYRRGGPAEESVGIHVTFPKVRGLVVFWVSLGSIELTSHLNIYIVVHYKGGEVFIRY